MSTVARVPFPSCNGVLSKAPQPGLTCMNEGLLTSREERRREVLSSLASPAQGRGPKGNSSIHQRQSQPLSSHKWQVAAGLWPGDREEMNGRSPQKQRGTDSGKHIKYQHL